MMLVQKNVHKAVLCGHFEQRATKCINSAIDEWRKLFRVGMHAILTNFEQKSSLDITIMIFSNAKDNVL